MQINGMRSLVAIIAACVEGSQRTLEHSVRLLTSRDIGRTAIRKSGSIFQKLH